ncbi:MAG: autotransporter-associated beta strand repeat-containing protein [Bacteroidetes bacterium]|nr:autotransporter-associated beta strand repeat-containing protein [Bacteroidota bacterium]
MKKLITLISLAFICVNVFSQTILYWDGNAPNGNWNENNWWNGFATTTPTGSEILQFDNNNQTSMINNLSGSASNRYRINFIIGASNARTITGTTENIFYDYSSNVPAIYNNSGTTHTINFPFANGNSNGANRLELNANSGGIIFGGNIRASGGTRTLVTLGSSTITFNGIISNGVSSTLNFTKEGSGTSIFNAANTYSGETRVTAGTLQLTGSGTFGSASSVYVSSGATLSLNNINSTVASVSETGTGNGGTVSLGSGNLTISGGWTGTRFQNSITGTGGITKQGTGILSLYGTQSYSGSTTISGGELSTSVTMSSTNFILNGGDFRIATNNIISNSANFNISAGTFYCDKLESINNVTISGTGILRVSDDLIINDLTISSGGSILIDASKTLTINGTVTYTGGTLSSAANGKIIYNQSSDGQNVMPGTYGDLQFNNFNKVLSNTGIIYIAGATDCFIPGTATGHTVTGSTIEFSRNGNQNVPVFTYYNLTFSGSSGTKTLTGSISVNGNLSITSSSIFSGATYTVNLAGNWINYNATGFSNTACTVNLNGSGSQTINTTDGEDFYILQKSGTGTTTLQSNVNILGAGSALNISNGILDAGNNSLSGSGSAALIMSGGTLQIAKLSTILPEIPSNYTISGGTIELNGAGSQTLRGARAYRNLTFSNSGTKGVTSAPSSITGTLIIAGTVILDVSNASMGGTGTNLTMTETSKLITGNAGLKPSPEGAYSLGGGTTIEFSGIGDLNPRVASISYYNVIISGTNVNITGTTDGLPFQSGGTFTVKDGAVFAFKNTNGFSGATNTAINNSPSPTIVLEPNSTIGYRGSTQSVTTAAYQNLRIGAAGIKTLAGNITVGGNLDLSAGELAATTYTITVSGNILGTATQTNTSGKISMTGASATISGATLGNLELNNASGFSLSGSPTINNVLTFTNGKLTMGANSITLASNAVGAIAGYNSSKYFVTDGAGYVRRAVTGPNAYDFPVGTSTNYDPAKITWTGASGSTELSTRFIAATLSNPTGLTSLAYAGLSDEPDVPTPITEFLNNGYWEITSTGAPNNYQIDLTASGAGNLAVYAQQHTIFKNSTTGPTGWAQAGDAIDIWGDSDIGTSGYQYTLTPNPLHLQNTNVSGFSYFAIGRSASYILPIVLTEFTAEIINTDVVLNWITASEVNNDYFSIERSMDGSIWNAIGQVDGAGSSSTVNHYDFTDKDAPGMVLYYRLKQIDFNGNYEYSPIRVVNNLGNEAYIIYGYYTLTGQQIETLENAPTGIYLQLSNKGNTKIFHNE